ncbi:hypothetical protein PR001_g13826 [Phytophthora rubi]|uniref:Reverse transcriptase domain-containing protein n=1 Tax=Phytophthora rubi TaxID=129364 RepID=A0A6A3LJV5_9STRA|nr:hypothetical protein PR001_g13826 [Phytophthora rubi]
MLVDEHIVLDLDDKFNMVLAMPWIARHDPVIDWTKRTIVHFGSSSAMALAVHATLQQRKRDVRLSPVTPRGHQRLKESLGENSDAVVSTISVDTQVQQEEPVTDKDSDLDATAQGADAIGTNVERRSAGIRRRCKEGASALGPTLQAVRTVANVPHRKCLHARVQPGCTTKRHAIKQGLIACARGLNPPAIKRKICPRPGLEKIRSAEPGSAHVANGASGNSLKSRSFDEVLREYRDVLPDDIPAEFSQDKGVQHEIDIVPGTKYCVTRQWPLRREQVKAIDDFFERRPKAGQVRESKSPHSAPTFRVKKAPGRWRIVHAYNKLNDATVPAQTPIPLKDVIIDSMALSTIFSALDLRNGFHQILMHESDIPLMAVSTPSGMLWEWLFIPQGLKNAPATLNRCVTHLLRSVRDFAPSYFDDGFIHSRAVDGSRNGRCTRNISASNLSSCANTSSTQT